MGYTQEIGGYKAIEHFAKNVKKTIIDIEKLYSKYGVCKDPDKSQAISKKIDELNFMLTVQKHELHLLCVNAGVADYNEDRYRIIEYGISGGSIRTQIELKKPKIYGAAKISKVVDEKGGKRQATQSEQFLIQNGWSQWYNPNYWVNPKVIDNPQSQDHTNYGFSLHEAVAYEKGYQQAIKNNAKNKNQ